MLSCLISHHICEIMSCYSVCLDNINVNYFMPCFLPYYPLHLSILQCLYIQLPVHLTTELVYQNEFHILHAKPMMCLHISLVECEQNIVEEYPIMKW